MLLRGHVALYGGSFNPPHVGHQMACLYLLEGLSADAVWIIPARSHPFGKTLADFGQRVQMCRLLAEPFAGRVEVSTVEDDADLSGKTFDTLCELRRSHPERRFALAVGSDILAETAQWYRWQDIGKRARVVVIGRTGHLAPGTTPVALPQVSSTQIRARLAAGESIDGLVPTIVADYIAREGLYLK